MLRNILNLLFAVLPQVAISLYVTLDRTMLVPCHLPMTFLAYMGIEDYQYPLNTSDVFR